MAKKKQEERKDDVKKVELLLVEISKLTEEIDKYVVYEQIVNALNQNTTAYNKLTDEYKELTSKKESILAVQDTITKEQLEFQNIEDAFFAMEQKVKTAQQWYIALKNMKELALLITEDETIKVERERTFQTAQTSYEQQNRLVEQMELAFFREQAGLLAKDLKEGQACPVCGSISHPNPAVTREEAPTQDAIKIEKQTLDAAHKNLQNCSVSLHEVNTKLQLQNKQLLKAKEDLEEELTAILGWKEENLSTNMIMLAMDQVCELGKSLSQQKKDLGEKKLKKEENTKQLSIFAKQLETIETAINGLKKTENELVATVARLKAEQKQYQAMLSFTSKKEAVEALQKKNNEVQALRASIEQVQTEIQTCEKELSGINAKLLNLEETSNKQCMEQTKISQKLQTVLYDTKIATMETYQNVIRSQSEIDELSQTIADYETACTAKSSQIQQLEKETKGLALYDLTILEEALQHSMESKQVCEKQKQNVYARLERNKKIYEVVHKKLKEQEKLKNAYLMINEIAKTATGDLSQKARITFEQYVQAFYFDRVVQEANKRLRRMTFDQYSLHRSTQAEDLRTSAGLDLVVMDHYTGKERSVKSLSGGESFKASLALALGLSDVIQNFAGGIELDAMFIDEGFGSLDSESLEQAIEILDSLATGNRLVGIISHVNELKERIDKKIIIHKTMEGSTIM